MNGAHNPASPRRARRSRYRGRLACVALLIAPAAATAQAAGYGIRAGVVLSTPIAEDQVANTRLAAMLGGGIGAVRAVPAPAFQVEAEASLPMRARTALDLAVGWTAAAIDAKDDAGTRRLQSAGVGHTTVSIRYLATPSLHGGCGVGILRYFAEARALFASGTELSPLLECAARLGVTGGPGRRVVLRVAGQMHRFRTPVLADAGARAGTVFRLAVQAGLDLGRGSR